MTIIDQLVGIAYQGFMLLVQLLISIFTFFIVALRGILHFFGVQ